MSKLNQTRETMLRLLWEVDSPMSRREIAQRTGTKARSANMHLLWLRRGGCVSFSGSSNITLTETGREALGFPKVDENLAGKVFATTSPEKAFYFYTGIDQPLGASSDGLVDFCEKINSVDEKSIEFHMARGDFELWVHYLGDIELATRLRLLREENLSGEALRERLYKTVKSRCDELLRTA